MPVKVLGRLYRGKFLAYLAEAYRSGELRLTATLGHLTDPECFAALVREMRRKSWLVYAKPPVAGPHSVLGYLARYTHRVAISNSRLVSFSGDVVRFGYTDRAGGGQERVMELEATEFLRRFLLHVLPRGFVRIRHYGLLANPCRRDNVELCRSLISKLGIAQGGTEHSAVNATGLVASITGCPRCGIGTMLTVATLRPGSIHPVPVLPRGDSS